MQVVPTAARAFVPPDRPAIFNRASSFEGVGCSWAGCHHETLGSPLSATRGMSDATPSSSAASRTVEAMRRRDRSRVRSSSMRSQMVGGSRWVVG